MAFVVHPATIRRQTEGDPGSGTFQDGHVDDGADLGHLILARGCRRLQVVAAPPAVSGRRSVGGGEAADQGEEHK